MNVDLCLKSLFLDFEKIAMEKEVERDALDDIVTEVCMHGTVFKLTLKTKKYVSDVKIASKW